MAVSLGGALGISEVKLPRQSVVAETVPKCVRV